MVGLLAPPGFPAKIASELADKRLPKLLAEQLGDEVDWDLRFVSETRAHDAKDDDELFDVARDISGREGWDVAVSLTDLPFAVGRRPVVADAFAGPAVAIVSLPALGPVRRRHEAGEVIARLVGFLAHEHGWLGGRRGADGPRGSSFVSPIREVSPQGEDADLRLVARPLLGHLRLVGGMVRANHPWRVVLDLSRALVVALSAAALALVTSSTWQLGEAVSTARQVAFMVVALTAMVTWLIVVHHLWERPAGGLDREQARLFNAATVVTLIVGATCFYAALFVLNVAAEALVLDPGVIEATIGHPVGLGDYLRISWFTSSLATLGGALGSGLEDRVEVREAAYSYHPERRSDS